MLGEGNISASGFMKRRTPEKEKVIARGRKH